MTDRFNATVRYLNSVQIFVFVSGREILQSERQMPTLITGLN
jgi:hypothetical protein